MRFITSTHTDIGTRKKTNQDSMMVMQAQCDLGPVLLASVCDGMGGLAKGEVASAAMVQALRTWFTKRLPVILAEGFTTETLRSDWERLVNEENRLINSYGKRNHVDMGTTAVVLLVIGNTYYTMNVGDSRIYLISDNIYQLTKDQTYVQREMDEGRMTPQQAAVDPQRNVLLQCIGASASVYPDFTTGQAAPGQVFMLCCDGFRHVVQPQEFYQAFQPKALKNQETMMRASDRLIQLNISRGEDDNISVVLVKTEA